MQKIALFFLFCVANTLAAQTKLTYYYDQNWKEVEVEADAEYIRKATPSDLFFVVEDFYANGKPCAKGQYKSIVDVKKTSGQTSQIGKFVWFFSDGTEQKSCTYEMGKLEGKYVENFPSGKIKVARTYKYGDILNEKVYSDAGKILSELNTEANTFVLFYANSKDTLCAKPYKPARFADASCTMTNGGALALCCERGFNAFLAQNNKTEGLNTKVLVRFKIDAAGKVSKGKVLESSKNDFADKEALRLIEALPNFVPAENKDKKVAVLMEKWIEIH
jgi:TonB family protein